LPSELINNTRTNSIGYGIAEQEYCRPMKPPLTANKLDRDTRDILPYIRPIL
jgi:hypothetical protein